MTPDQFIERVLTQPQVPFYRGGVPHGTKISKHLTVGVDHLASPDTGSIILYKPLLDLFDEARDILGHPLPVNAGFRTPNHQRLLIAQGYKAATALSPHMVAAALDVDAVPRGTVSEVEECLAIVNAFEKAAALLSLPAPRLGYSAYALKFVHIDLVFMLFQPYTSLPHPSSWAEGLLDLSGRPWKPNGLGSRDFFANTWKEGFRF